MSLKRVPLTFEGRIAFEVENALAAIGAAWSLGVPIGSISSAAETFCTNEANVPGRFNIHEVRGATVIVDYGHNADALRAIVNAIETFPHKRRTALYSMAGDRRDKDIVAVGRMLGNAFDRVILYEAHTVRGREPGEISNLMRRGLADGSRVREVEAINGSIKSMEYALDTVDSGELLLLQADYIDETVDFVSDYLQKLRASDEGQACVANVWDFEKASLPRVRTSKRPKVRMSVPALDLCTGMMAQAPLGAKIW
jgi:cyanophycin synthetase